MKPTGRIYACCAATALLAVLPAQAAGPPRDSDWPCQQAKISEFPLASVWDGPPLDLNASGWRDDPETATLEAQMSQRRVPIAEVKGAVEKLLAANAAGAKAKVKQAFAAAFA